ncbi:MAG TPA: hypothetical protein VFC78_23315 [Tepidisphaeraceae bacterium]|nr:hypothetical protein [Tepidisphaeraceae bacterium]
MNAVRIRKRLDKAIPELPELTPLIGKNVEIIVLEEGNAQVPPIDLAAIDAIAGTDAMDFEAVEELRAISEL